MLGQQFYENAKFRPFLDKNFVLYRAANDTPAGQETFKRFAINSTPTALVLGGDGAEVDWFVGYSPPPEKVQARLEKTLKGEGTYKALAAAYAKDPKDVATVFALARKWADRDLSAGDVPKAWEKYKEVIALDPAGKAGSYTDGETFITAPYTEYAKYYLAVASLQGEKSDLKPTREFITANPQSRLVKQAYKAIAMNHYGFGGASGKEKAEADAFYAEYTSRFPNDPIPMLWWLTKIVREKGPVDKGLELAARLRELTVDNPSPGVNRAIVDIYDLAGQRDKAGEVYGKEFMAGRVQTLGRHLVSYANYWIGRKENREDALAMADLAFKLGPDTRSMRESVAEVYLKAGEVAKALEVYGPAWVEKKEAEKSDLDLFSYSSFWVRADRNIDGALDATKKAIAIQRKDFLYMYWARLSDLYLKKGDRAEAIKAAEKAVELAPANQKPALQKKLDGLKAAPEKK